MRPLAADSPECEVISYQEAKRLARHEDTAVRIALSRRGDLRPEVLYYLAEDPAPEVRRAIAENRQTPVQADLLLALDADQRVRESLAGKIASLTAEMSRQDQGKAQRYVLQTLELLAIDQAVRVRRILADSLKHVTDAPPDVIKRLASDVDDLVASPILEFSPLLSDLDLLEIIGEGCNSTRLRAISRRQGLGEQVADAIIETDDAMAVAELLSNESAQIREETLDGLVERAVGVPEWHEPLVCRPRLSSAAACKLASFVAGTLLTRLKERRDLDSEAARLVASEVHRRLREGDAGPDAPEAAEANALGDMSNAEVMRAIAVGDRNLVRAILALRSGLHERTVDRILASGSPKAVTALAWRAGLTMRLATQLQIRLAGIAPPNALNARGGSEFPMRDDELSWQIEFFESLST